MDHTPRLNSWPTPAAPPRPTGPHADATASLRVNRLGRPQHRRRDEPKHRAVRPKAHGRTARVGGAGALGSTVSRTAGNRTPIGSAGRWACQRLTMRSGSARTTSVYSRASDLISGGIMILSSRRRDGVGKVHATALGRATAARASCRRDAFHSEAGSRCSCSS